MPSALYATLLSLFHLFPLHSPVTLWILDAPHGRFALPSSRLNLPGKPAWLTMEIVSPLSFLYALLSSNSSSPGLMNSELDRSTLVLVTCYLLHYGNRAVVSVLRSEGMGDSHVATWASAVGFNAVNGFLVGSYLRTNPAAKKEGGSGSWLFWVGVVIWAVGWAGNVTHDEILLSLRRRARLASSSSSSDSSKKADTGSDSISIPSSDPSRPPRMYFVPRGGLFRWVSFPNYLSELLEWTGFALACSSPLFLSSSTSLADGFLQQPALRSSLIRGYRLLTPAWLFLVNEIATLVPRAISGHKWYQDKFGEKLPKGRKAIVPGLL